MKKNLLAILLLSLCALSSAFAQNRTITGKVTSADDGQPLPGVSVKIQGTSKGTQTNSVGDYTLEVPADTKTLVFSFIGYSSQTASASGKTAISIKLVSDAKSLSEVVVTGYGTQKKSEITGSIISISGAASIEEKPIQTLDKALQGRAAGVQVSSNSGQPGGGINVVIRGVATINGSTQPLYIIDGVQVTPGGLSGQTSVNALASINPDDIESIEVIKDGAAAAVYGSLAGNGVVIVTTKRGKNGKTQISASAQYGQSTAYNPYKLTDGPTYFMLLSEAYENYRQRQGYAAGVGTAQAAAASFSGGVIPSTIPTYDYTAALAQKGKVQQYDLSLAGGDAKTKFFISGSYNSTGGSIIGSYFTRGTVRANLDHKVSDKFMINSSITLTGESEGGPSTSAGFFTNTPFTAALLTAPINPIYNADGTFNTSLVGTNSQNEVQNITQELRTVGTFQTVSNVALTYNFLPEFSFKAFGGLDFADLRDFNYRPSTLSAAAAALGSGAETFRRNINYNLSGTFNYNKKFGDHNISALAGFEYRSVVNRVLAATSQTFPSTLLNLLSSGAIPTAATSTFTGYKIAGFLGQVKYDYKSKYLFTANLRNDGSSRFGENNKYGLFYGFSGGWIMTKEDFMKDLTFVSTVKPRISYGVTGSQPSSSAYDFISLALYGGGGQYGSPGLLGGLRASQIPNMDFRWEKSKQIDIGLDLGFFNERVTLALDIYRKTNSDLILGVTIPGDLGYTSYTQNAGSAKSEGYDIDLNTININRNGFKWSTNFNVSFNRNKLLSLVNGQTQINTYQYTVGMPLNNIYTYRWAGVNPADGRAMYYDANNNITYAPKASTDQAIIGNQNPRFFGGFSNTLTYKGVTLDFLFQYQYGNMAYLQSQQYTELAGSLANVQNLNQLQRWTTPGQITWVPRGYNTLTEPGGISLQTLSSRFVEDASYIRLKQTTVRYQLPKSITSKIGIPSISVFGQGINLWTITHFRGDDPENTGNNLNFYPNPRTFTAGINVKF